MATQTPSASVRIAHAPRSRIRTDEVLVLLTASASVLLALFVLLIPLELTDGLATAMTALLAMSTVFILTPPLIARMKAGGMVGVDVNKRTKTPIAELGGISALFAFSLSLSLVVGFQKLLGNVAEPPFLAAISVFFIASTIGLIDDISDLPQRIKAVAVAFAALPLMLVHLGAPVISFPFGLSLPFLGEAHLFYWLILVPIGVTGVANAMNMSAGYNGLETGQIVVISATLLVVGQLRGAPDVALLVFGSTLGCALALFYFNRYPAQVFVGDIGTLGLGAGLAAGIILAHLEFYGLVAIAPAFFEAIVAIYFGAKGVNGARKKACRNPVLLPDGRIAPPEGASHYTLPFLLLSLRPMKESHLVAILLLVYAVAGTVAICLSVL